jgi:hypothetical protein
MRRFGGPIGDEIGYDWRLGIIMMRRFGLRLGVEDLGYSVAVLLKGWTRKNLCIVLSLLKTIGEKWGPGFPGPV